MNEAMMSRRNKDEFVSFTIHVLCEKQFAAQTIGDAAQATANVDGCVQATIVRGPIPLTDYQWNEVDEEVNALISFQEDN